MSELFRVLVLYYACDIAATARNLTPPEWTICMGYYAEVKRHFAEDETGPKAHRIGYLRFKAWEAENPAIVSDLRARGHR